MSERITSSSVFKIWEPPDPHLKGETIGGYNSQVAKNISQAWNIWKGMLFVSKKLVGNVKIWAYDNNFIPNLGNLLRMQSRLSIDKFWDVIMNSLPCQLSLDRETILSNGRAVSVHIISSKEWRFMQLHQELNKITVHSPGEMSSNNSPIVLVGTVINPGVGVEVVLAPPCQQTEDMGLSIPYSVQQPLMYAFFITSKCAAEARNIYKLQRDYVLQNMTFNCSPNENVKGEDKILSKKELIHVKKIKENHPYKEKIDNDLDTGVNIKENLSNTKSKEKDKIGKKALLDTMKFKSLFESKDKKKPDMIKPSMLKRPLSKSKGEEGNDSQNGSNAKKSCDSKKIEINSPEKDLGKSWKNLAVKYGLKEQFIQKKSKYECSENVTNHSKGGVLTDKELKCTKDEILIRSKNEIEKNKFESNKKEYKSTSNKLSKVASATGNEIHTNKSRMDKKVSKETSNMPSKESSTRRVSDTKIMLQNKEKISTKGKSSENLNSSKKPSSQENSGCKNQSNTREGIVGMNRCSVDNKSPSNDIPSKILPNKEGISSLGSSPAREVFFNTSNLSLARSSNKDQSISKEKKLKRVSRFRKKVFKSKVSKANTCNLKRSCKKLYSRSSFYRFKARFKKGSMSVRTLKLLNKLKIRDSKLKANKKCRNSKKGAKCQNKNSIDILKPGKPKKKALIKENLASPFKEKASVSYSNVHMDKRMNIINENKSLDAVKEHTEMGLKRKSDNTHELSSKKFKLEPMIMLKDIFNSLSAQKDAEIYKFVAQNVKKEAVSDNEDCQRNPEMSNKDTNNDAVLIKKEKLTPPRSKSKTRAQSSQIDSNAVSKKLKDSENISICNVSENNNNTSADDSSSLITLDSQKVSAQYVRKQKLKNISSGPLNFCNSKSGTSQNKSPEIIDVSRVKVKTEVDENLVDNNSNIMDGSTSPDISEIIDIPLSNDCFITKKDVKILDNVLKRFKSSSLKGSSDVNIEDKVSLSPTKRHEKLEKQDESEIIMKDKEKDKQETLESKSVLVHKECLNDISNFNKGPGTETKGNCKKSTICSVNNSPSEDTKDVKENQTHNHEDAVNCREDIIKELASEIDNSTLAVFGENAEIELKEILSDWTVHRSDGLDFLTSITKDMTSSKYIDVKPSKKLDMTIGDLIKNFANFDISDLDNAIYNEILKINMLSKQENGKELKEISSKCSEDLNFEIENKIQEENGQKATSCTACNNKSKKFQTLPDNVGPFHFDDSCINKENGCNLKLKKWIHLYNAKEGDAKKLKVVAPMCSLKVGSLEQVCEDGGFVFIQEEDIQSFLSGGKSSILLPQDNITFCPFSSIKKIFEGKAIPFLIPGCLLLIHHTSLFDECLSAYLEPLIEKRSSEIYPLFIPIATLKDCLEVLEKITAGKSKNRRILSRNMFIITKCINEGIISVLFGDGKWQGLGPCSSSIQYIDALKALHIHTGLQTRKASLLIGKRMQRPEIPGLVYGTKLPQVAFG